MDTDRHPLHRLGDTSVRAGTGLLSLAMAVVLARFLSQSDTLRLFTIPMVGLFVLFGWIRPSLGLYPLIFALPLLPLVPHVRGVSNFSLVEIAWWALCIGRLARRTIAPRPLRMPPPPSWPLLALLTLVVCGSAAVRLTRNHLWSDPLIWQILWERLADFFRWPQDSTLFPLRAMVVWLEGVAFLALVRRNAPRPGFQQRVRVLLIISLTFVVLASIHQLFLTLTQGPEVQGTLADWELETDWVPPGWAERLQWLRALHGPWPDVNSFASYLLMSLPLVLSAFILSRNVFGRTLLMILGAAVSLVLFLTFSRIAWLWFPVTVAAWALLSRSRARRIWWWIERGGRRWIWIGFALVLAGLAVVTTSETALEGIARVNSTPNAERVNVLLKGRLTLWETALRMAHTDPIFGRGWGSFYHQRIFFHRPEDSLTSRGEEVWNPEHENAHNQFFQVLAESGLLGLGLIALLMGQWFGIALRTAAWGRGELRWSTRGLMTAIFALTGTLLTGHALLLIEMLFFFWTLVGLAFVEPRGPRLPDPPTAPPPWSGRAQVAAVALVMIFAGRVWAVRGAPDLVPYGVGLYSSERDEASGIPYQWTRDQANLVLRNIQGECAFHLSNARSDRHPVTVEVRVDGELRGRLTPPDHHWWPYRFGVDLPRDATYRLDLRVLDTFHNPDDPPDRVFGIRFRLISY